MQRRLQLHSAIMATLHSFRAIVIVLAVGQILDVSQPVARTLKDAGCTTTLLALLNQSLSTPDCCSADAFGLIIPLATEGRLQVPWLSLASHAAIS
jgi:hypothetical protein